MTLNAFEAVAERQIASPVRRNEEARARRAAAREAHRDSLSAAQKREAEAGALWKSYRRFKRAQRDALLATPAGARFKPLFALLRRLTIDDAGALLAALDKLDLETVCADDRFVVLQSVDRAIVRVRVNAGLPEFDDAIPFAQTEDRQTIFDIAKRKLMGDER